MHPRLFLSISLCFAVLTTAGCSRLYTFTGIVVDGDGLPIADALVLVRPHDWPEKESWGERSNSEGQFLVEWGSAIDVEFFKLTTTKEGFDSDVRLVKADATDLRVVLSRTQKDGSKPGQQEL